MLETSFWIIKGCLHFPHGLFYLEYRVFILGFLISIPIFSFLNGFVILRFILWKSFIVTLIPTIFLFLAYFFLSESIFMGKLFDDWVPKF